jgi:hypothetical protein
VVALSRLLVQLVEIEDMLAPLGPDAGVRGQPAPPGLASGTRGLGRRPAKFTTVRRPLVAVSVRWAAESARRRLRPFVGALRAGLTARRYGLERGAAAAAGFAAARHRPAAGSRRPDALAGGPVDREPECLPLGAVHRADFLQPPGTRTERRRPIEPDL